MSDDLDEAFKKNRKTVFISLDKPGVLNDALPAGQR